MTSIHVIFFKVEAIGFVNELDVACERNLVRL